MKIRVLSLVCLLAVSAESFAVDATPFFSFYAGAGSWSSDIAGDLGTTSTSVDELGLSDDSNVYYYAAFEHAVPVIPNVRLEYINISSSGSGTLTQSFVLDGVQYDQNTVINTDLDLTFTDAILYYEILMFDFGLTFRQFDMEIAAVGTSEGVESLSTVESVDGVLPMVYAQTKIDLPFTGLYVTGNFNGISYDDKSVSDYRAAVGYGIEIPVVAEIGLELGYRAFEIDLGDEEDIAGDVEFSGIYFGANVKF